MDATRPCCGNAFGLPFAYAVTLAMGNEREDLQDDASDESPHQIFAIARIQQGHIYHSDVNVSLFSQYAVLIKDGFVISAHTINTHYPNKVAGAQLFKQRYILGV